jgi:GT2 family glycosyltransferase
MSHTHPQVSIIIVSYETRELLAECLTSLARGVGDVPVEIVVVDNASTDGSADMVERDFPQVKLIRSSENAGFAAANNLAMVQASGDYLFFLNPDTLLTCNTLPKLVRFLDERPQAAVAGAGLTYPGGRYQAFSFRFPSLFREFWNVFPELKWLFKVRAVGKLLVSVFHVTSSNWSESTQPRAVECVNGAAFFARASAVRDMNGFDSTFFLYHEEMDLCTRLRKSNWQVWTCPQAQVIHYDAQSSGYSTRTFARSPILEWRVKGMDYLWRQHRSKTMHRLWRRQTRQALWLRAGLLGLRKWFAQGPRKQEISERIQKLNELRNYLSR